MNSDYTIWVSFYQELANTLLNYRHDRTTLIAKLFNIYNAANRELPTVELNNENVTDIDPFTIFAFICRRLKTENRTKILQCMANEFGIESIVPTSFDGIPLVDPRRANFFRFSDARKENDIENLWKVFTTALDYEKSRTEENKAELIKIYDIAIQQQCVGTNLSMGLYWIRPYMYMTLDSVSKNYIRKASYIPSDLKELVKRPNSIPNGETYIKITELCHEVINQGVLPCSNFPELSYHALLFTQAKASESINNNNSLLAPQDVESEDDSYRESQTQAQRSYTKENFLQDVYLNEAEYELLVKLLRNKKNLILQGPPGVGKTFVAERLAYSMIGCQAVDRIMIVQFHQSYSYEDFIMGYKPDANGFKLQTGPFYEFCKQAKDDYAHEYFLLIDEINRGNLNKIFGEMFMLIENNKRDKSLHLLYSNEEFSVPKNLYIIGTMNSADRSLTTLDYAMRRRFAFFEMTPAFQAAGFLEYRQKQNNPKFDKLIFAIEQLNEVITRDTNLGKDFCIGHSYFCTYDADDYTDGHTELDDDWLVAVIEYEIIPLLHEYWFDEPSKVQDWSQKLRESVQ